MVTMMLQWLLLLRVTTITVTMVIMVDLGPSGCTTAAGGQWSLASK